MIALLFLVGVMAIVCFARYNEDDRLFWKMLTAMVVAFVLTDIVQNTKLSKDNEVDSPVQVYSTYPTAAIASPDITGKTAILVGQKDVSNKKEAPIGYTPAIYGDTSLGGKIIYNARGQPCTCGNLCNCKQPPGVKPEIQDDS